MLKNQRGFTLVELIVVIVIIGILAAVAIPQYIDLTTKASEATAKGVLGGIRSANSLLYANRLINGTTAAFGWANVIGAAQIQGVSTGSDATYLTVTAGGVSYSFSLSPTNPVAPTTPATIYCVGHTDW